MSEINLEEAKINHDGEWLSAEELSTKIQEKMQGGDMKFADLAAALEQLNKAMENSQTLEIKTIITKDEYDKLKAVGGDDDKEAVKKAILAFIGEDSSQAGGKKKVIKCSKCKAPIEIPAGEIPSEIKCPKCNAVGRLKPKG